jgi:hypothetical protein
MRALRLLVVFAAFSVAASAEPAAKTYEQLVAQAESGDPATDFTALRMAYAQSADYDGYGMASDGQRQAFIDAANAEDCPKAITFSEALLKADYTYPLVHLVRAVCFDKQGNAAHAQLEGAIFKGLTNSILASGDGKSTATAYVVVTMAEERFVLMHFDLDEKLQALVTEGGHNYDRIDGVNEKTGAKESLYFNVDAMFGSLTRKLGGAKQEQAN